MKRKIKNKDAAHLQRKLLLYESFLYRYLPQISSVSHISRFNIFDLSGRNGFNKLGTQGSPFVIYKALQKQRQHQLKNRLNLKPFSLSVATLRKQSSFSTAKDLLTELNNYSNTCKLESFSSSFSEGIRKVFSQLRQQATGEKNLIFLDPMGAPGLSLSELRLFSGKKAEIILYLPLKDLWLLHTPATKNVDNEDILKLKEALDDLFPPDHLIWSSELTQENFYSCLKEAFRFGEVFFTAMEPSGGELAEGALLVMSSEAYMMEKVLISLQALRFEDSTPPGEQISLFNNEVKQEKDEDYASAVQELLKEGINNQQLYKAGLQEGLLPRQLTAGLQNLIEAGKIKVFDGKRKTLPDLPPNCIGYTAFKAVAPVCTFSRLQ